jgi:hypothetical protein
LDWRLVRRRAVSRRRSVELQSLPMYCARRPACADTSGCQELELAKVAGYPISEKECFRLEIRSMSIQYLKQSLPELSDAAFDKVYTQFFIKAHATVLGYEVSRCTGLAQGEGWDKILDCFDAERERRYGGARLEGRGL